MSLVERAKKKARDDAEAKEKEAKAKIDFQNAIQEALTDLSKEVLGKLKEFHNVKCRFGTLKLEKKKDRIRPHSVLKLVRDTVKAEEIELLLIESRIESGTRDYSDDCRDVPYTEAVVNIFTQDRDRLRSRQDRMYIPANEFGLQSFSTYATNWNDRVEKSLEEVADWLAPLFSSK
jgi:hypothetical protein